MPLQSETRKDNEMCARQGGIEFKGKVYKRKYPRQEDRVPDPKQSQEPEPMTDLVNEAQSGNSLPEPQKIVSNRESLVESDTSADLPIALRKGTRSCTKHPLYNFLSYKSLSPSFQAFTSQLSCVTIPKDIQEALGVPEWREAVLEEMRALEKNKTWELVRSPNNQKVVGSK